MSQTTDDIIILIDILVDCQGNEEPGDPIFDITDLDRLGQLKSSILKKLNNEEEAGNMKDGNV